MPNILIIDDNEEILTANKEYLTTQGYDVTCVDTGIKALTYLNDPHNRYDCIVLDVLLPDLDGFTLCKAARTITDTPVLFLSCLEESDDKIKGLMSGGDDYMTKPYSLKELHARIQTIMRRGTEKPSGDFYIDRGNKLIHVLGKNVLLSEREFNLFLLFYEHPKLVFSKEELLNRIWYGNAEIGVVAVLVLKLRRKIEFAESVIGCIENDYGTGYHLEPPDAEEMP